MLSVIIPAHNVANTLGEQLEALKAQEYQGDWEIIVVNNRSTDTTADLVRDYQQLLPHLHLVDAPEKKGSYYARNVGVRFARGEAFVFCDADDVVAPDWLSVYAQALEKYDLVAGMLEVESLNHCAPWRRLPTTGAQQSVLGFMPFVVGCNMAVSRQAFEAVNGYSEEFLSGGDVDLAWRLQLAGYDIHDTPALVHYRYRDTLRALWKQSVKYGYYHTLLYRRFAPYGMPRLPVRKVIRKKYKPLIRQGLRLLLYGGQPAEQSSWVSMAGLRWGRILGSIRYRILYL